METMLSHNLQSSVAMTPVILQQRLIFTNASRSELHKIRAEKDVCLKFRQIFLHSSAPSVVLVEYQTACRGR